jgi:hypothetical protein
LAALSRLLWGLIQFLASKVQEALGTPIIASRHDKFHKIPGDEYLVSMMMKRCLSAELSQKISVLMAAIFPAAILALYLFPGTSLTPDSLVYFFAAEHFLDQGSILKADGNLLTLFPPLYPVVLALMSAVTGSLSSAAATLNIFCLLVASASLYALLRRIDIRHEFAALITLVVFMNPNMQWIFSHAWSEALYIAITLLILLFCHQIGKSTQPHPIRMGIFAGGLVGLAFLTRYIGVSLLPVVLTGFLYAVHWPMRQRLHGMVAAIAAGTGIMVLWLLRNYQADHTLMGERAASSNSLGYALEGLVTTAGRFLTPGGFLLEPATCIVEILILLILVGASFQWSRKMALLIAPAATWILCHTGLLIHAQLTTHIDQLNARYVSPEIAAIALCLAGIFRYGRFSMDRSSKRIPALFIFSLYLLAAVVS